jgi:hypothetical protein
MRHPVTRQEKRRGIVPRLLFLLYELSPVSFLQYVPAVTVNPAVSNPVRTGMRWAIIVTSDPYVARTIPAMVSRYPFISGARTRPGMFNHGDGRSNTHNNLRVSSNGQQAQSEQYCESEFLHEYILLYLWSYRIYYLLFERW